MKKFLLTLLSISVILISGAVGFFTYLFLNDPYREFKDYENDIDKAYSLYDADLYQESLDKIKEYNDLLTGNSYKYYSKSLEGKNYYQLEQYPQAMSSLQEFEKFISVKEHTKKIKNHEEMSYENNLFLALTYYQLQDYKLSQSYFDKVVEDKNKLMNLKLKVHSEEVVSMYAETLIHNQKYDDAISILNELINESGVLKETKANSLKLIGDIYAEHLDDNEQAISYYEKSYSINKSLPVIEKLADLYLELEDYESALSYIKTGEQLFNQDKNVASLYTYEGILLYKLGEFEESIEILEISEELLVEEENMEEEDKQKIHTTNVMYLMYDYFHMKDYQKTSEIIDEILNDMQFDEEMKQIAEEYKVDVDSYLGYRGY